MRKYSLAITIYLAVFILCVSIGSVTIPIEDILHSFKALITGQELNNQYDRIIYYIRIPRVIVAGLVGVALALSGAIMQGLLKNPLADGSTLGISSGASLGAVIAIVTGFNIPRLPYYGTVIMAIIFAFGSLVVILSISYRIDKTLSNNTVILVGVIFSMTASSLISLLIAIFNNDIQRIIFWTMGSLSGSTYENATLLLVAIIIFGVIALTNAEELNAFSLGEDQARNLGVDVKKIRILLFLCSSALIGTAVAVGGNIGFVGLIIPHITRLIFGSNHKIVLPMTCFIGAIFLMITDLISRTLFSPTELPIGVITALIGSVLFLVIFSRRRS
ncbi:FecCD family ABC transporter permease [Fundicoccus culcitae]|uniref:Iron ABC transporter permease n=1 Tax=Fundicoccus culcitae TaxID=2969821 RepID=A0ABY5P3M7_9LACT|nr:iron ABC transporter permease [Fundicoccus culcitae]UUX33341.1 iron ABC transporter permease [Fundicoccus culcitae]